MKPFASDGDYAVATRIFLNIRIGDVLIFRSPVDGSFLIKRVKNLENTPEGRKFFMEGDNRMRSTDSNSFGAIGRDSVLGKVIYVARKRRSQ